jgi:hypothetical protein
MKTFFDYLFHPRIQSLWKPYSTSFHDWEWCFSLFDIDLYETEYRDKRGRKPRTLKAIKITILDIEFAWKWWTK